MTKLNRRALLRAFAAGTATLPLLRGLTSRAEENEEPRYLVLLFTPCGMVQPLFGAECARPLGDTTAVSSSVVFRETLSPLESLKQKVIVLDGLSVKAAGGAHEAGMGALWTGVLTGQEGLGVSIDQAIRGRLAPRTPFGSIELMVRSSQDFTGREAKTRMIYAAPSSYVDPMDDPIAARRALFPSAGAGEGSTPSDPKTFIRRKVLERVNAELSALAPRLCAEDRAQLDATRQAFSELDQQLARVADATRACRQPSPIPPGFQVPSHDFPTSAKLQMDLLALALACDLTRVASLQFSTATSQLTHTWLGDGQKMCHHDYSHEGPLGLEVGRDPYDPALTQRYTALSELKAIDRWYAEQVAYLANALERIPVANGKTLLDQTTICWSSEVSIGAAHNHTFMPFVLLGGGGGRLRTGQVIRFPNHADDASRPIDADRAHNDLLITLAHVMGVPIDYFGDASLCTGPIREILT